MNEGVRDALARNRNEAVLAYACAYAYGYRNKCDLAQVRDTSSQKKHVAESRSAFSCGAARCGSKNDYLIVSVKNRGYIGIVQKRALKNGVMEKNTRG